MRLVQSIFAVVFLACVSAAADDAIRVRIYHTNDIHGWVMSRPDKLQKERQIGGAAALASLIAKETGPKLVLDAGDWWQGTPEGSLSKGAAVADVFNAIGYDAVVIGNHEYDSGQEDLKALLKKIKAPVLSANTYGSDGKLASWVQPWIIKEVAGVKIGIFGLTTSNMHRLAFSKNIAGLDFRKEVAIAREAVKALKKNGATVIVAVTHVGFEQDNRPPFEGDQTIAREVPGIDVIVGGHTHDFLVRPTHEPVNGTLIVQAGHYLSKAGRVTLDIDAKTKRVTASSGELIDLWPDRVGESVAVRDIVASYTREVDRVFAVVIATAPETLNRETNRESRLGDWMTDCYRAKTGVEVSLQNGGGIRTDLPAGPVTLRSLFNIMPFDNALVTLTLKGSDVRDLIDHGVVQGRMLQLSGARVEYWRSRDRGQRIDSLAIGGAAVDAQKTYSVSALDFMVEGGDGYSAFDRFISSQAVGVLARDALIECARREKTIVAPPGNRLISREE